MRAKLPCSVSPDFIKNNINNLLVDTDFSQLGVKYSGKVRDCYSKNGVRYLVTSDRLSCFDVILTAIPFKGQVLSQMAAHWFKLSSGIAPNAIIDIPDPNVMVVKECEIFPIEVVVRGYLTGSAWRDYQAGKDISGIKLPDGLKMSERFSEPLITPSTKEAKGSHDMPISEEQIIAKKIVDPGLWRQVRQMALELFKLGQQQAALNGLIMVDTKYEFGLHKGEILLADEIHTLDCSRYWMADTYQQRYNAGESQDMLDKEVVRQWLLAQGYKGEGTPPIFTDEYRAEVCQQYIASYEKITGQIFTPQLGTVAERIKKNLKLI